MQQAIDLWMRVRNTPKVNDYNVDEEGPLTEEQKVQRDSRVSNKILQWVGRGGWGKSGLRGKSGPASSVLPVHMRRVNVLQSCLPCCVPHINR